MLALSLALDPVTPAPATWDAITARTGGRTRGDPARIARSRWPVALAAVVAMAALGLAWFMLQRPERPETVASVAAQDGPQLWRVETYTGGARLLAQVTGTIESQPGRSYELWALPEGGVPVSLGLMPESGRVERDLTNAQRAALRMARKVAVSLEPSGGSKTGAPTGPVLYVSEITRTG
jgi:anti-sigma-K factor RskA